MQVRFYKALWGMDGALHDQLRRIKEAGYDGFEAPLVADASTLKQAAADHGLSYVAMLFVEDPEGLKEGLNRAGDAGAGFANVHSGKDWWSTEQAARFFERALEVQDSQPLEVLHETHRGRALYSPRSTRLMLERFPELRLTADFSHWTCVCESMLDDQQESVNLAIERTSYVHARVGYEQGPQVPDPRAPEWSQYVERFEAWWDAIAERHRAQGAPLRVDPEFGPPHYMHTTPYSKEPVADLWDVCLWMRDRLRDRWS